MNSIPEWIEHRRWSRTDNSYGNSFSMLQLQLTSLNTRSHFLLFFITIIILFLHFIHWFWLSQNKSYIEGHSRRVISIIGDGSFQLTAQEVATMIRQRVKVLIFLMNNRWIKNENSCYYCYRHVTDCGKFNILPSKPDQQQYSTLMRFYFYLEISSPYSSVIFFHNFEFVSTGVTLLKFRFMMAHTMILKTGPTQTLWMCSMQGRVMD